MFERSEKGEPINFLYLYCISLIIPRKLTFQSELMKKSSNKKFPQGFGPQVDYLPKFGALEAAFSINPHIIKIV